ncbi:MAG: SpoIIE family protein phosphatase [Oscillibacter sp.]|nr:SpoIIE family protein phosphatase [Oscillibacter sp.]
MKEQNGTNKEGAAVKDAAAKNGVEQRTISRQMLRVLLSVVTAAFALALALIYAVFTWLAIREAANLMESEILSMTGQVDFARSLLSERPRNVAETASSLLSDSPSQELSQETLDRLQRIVYEAGYLTGQTNIEEVSVVDSKGEVIASEVNDANVSESTEMVGFHMDSTPVSRDFYRNLKETGAYTQEDFGPGFTDPGASVLYTGAMSESGVAAYFRIDRAAYSAFFADMLYETLDGFITGRTGMALICDSDKNVISCMYGRYTETVLDDALFPFDIYEEEQLKLFRAKVEGVDSYVMTGWNRQGEYCAITTYPIAEVFESRNAAVAAMLLVVLSVLGGMAALLAVLMNRTVVRGVTRIAASLARITDGDLEERVDVRSAAEFDTLSNDINATVDSLKRLIAEEAARIDAELAYAKQIQLSALPSVFPPFPKRTEFDLYARMDTAKEVGGDFYDFYLLDGDRLAFLIADVSGKGIPAALFMMRAKTMIRNLAEENHSVNEILTLANRGLCEGNDAGMFVTVWMCILNYRTGEAEYANAGHNQPVLRRKDGTFEYLTTRPGFVLAGLKQVKYRKNTLTFHPGDEIYLYTDGVTEANNAEEAMFGEARLAASLNGVPDDDARVLCDRVKADVDGFVGDAPQFDDITMVCLRYLGA